MTAIADPSRRFVAPPDAPLVRNLAALWASDPALARLVEAVNDDAMHAMLPTKVAGAPTVVVRTAAGTSISLHSRYQPLDEARRLVASAEVAGRAVFFVHGLGLGYHIEALLEAASEEALIFVLEPDLALVRTALAHRDLTALWDSRRVTLVHRPDKGELFGRLTPNTALVSVGMSIIAHAPSIQAHPQFHAQMGQWLAEFASFTRTNMNTLLLNGRRTCENIARNLGWYVATPSLSRLADRYKGRPAIIVSAGPSLRKNKHLLKDAAGRAVIVAVQTTLQPLLEMGVEPDFVTSLDYHDICTRFFEKLPPTLRTELVAEPKASAAIFSLYPGPLSLLGNDLADRLVRELGLEKTRLTSGATVAHLAYYVADHLGCDPIIFVGQDLGFSDGLCYAPGTSYEDVWRPELGRFGTVEMKQWEQIVRERHILRKVPDYQGRPTYTEERLFTYLQHFERDFARARARVIDATEGGVLKRGATPMTLADALAQFCTSDLHRAPADHPGLHWERLGDCAAALDARRAEAARVEAVARETVPLLEEVRDHLDDDQPRVNRAIARLDALRARMSELGPVYDLVLQMTQRSELARFQRDRQIAASKSQGVDRQRQQVARDIENVRSIADAAGEFQKVLVEVAAGIAATARERRTPTAEAA